MSSESEPAVKPTVIDLEPEEISFDADASPPHRDAPAPKPARRGLALGLPALASLLVIGLIAGGWFYRHYLSVYFPDDHVTALADRVDVLGKGFGELAPQVQGLDRLSTQLKTDVDALEEVAGNGAAENKSLAQNLEALRTTTAALQQAVDETRATVADLSSRPAVIVAAPGNPVTGDASSAMLTSLAARLEALEKDVAALKVQKSGAVDTVALTQTLSDLKAKIAAGKSFAEEQARMARMLPAAAGLDVLAAHSAEGLPDAKGLGLELQALTPALPVPEANDGDAAGQGVWARMSDALSSIIRVRDMGTINWQQVAATASAFADSNELAEAVAALDAVESAPPPALQEWRDRAAARLALEVGLASLSESVARTLAAGK